jgi:hypothetical protein
MKILQGFLIFMGVLAVLAIIALVVGYVMALLTPDIRANMRPVVLSSEAVDSLNQKLSDVKKATAAAEGSKTAKEIQLVITEEEVNSTIVMALAEGTLPAKEMLVNFNDGYLLTYTAWNFPGLPFKTGLIGTLDVEKGKPRFVIRDFYLGKLPVPDFVDAGVQEWINILFKLNAPMEELNFELKEVTIGDGQLKLAGTTKTGK